MKEKIFIEYQYLIFILFLYLLILIPFLGVETKGSKRWLDFPTLPRFQPIELLKPTCDKPILSQIIGSRSSLYQIITLNFFKHITMMVLPIFIVVSFDSR